jgi:predicted component of type VI protein secretion system
MKYLLLVLLLAGCSTTVPVTAKFPDAPKYSMEVCPQLEKLNTDAKLSDVATTVTINYSTYYECAVKNDAWIEWYQIQKNIFESVK